MNNQYTHGNQKKLINEMKVTTTIKKFVTNANTLTSNIGATGGGSIRAIYLVGMRMAMTKEVTLAKAVAQQLQYNRPSISFKSNKICIVFDAKLCHHRHKVRQRLPKALQCQKYRMNMIWRLQMAMKSVGHCTWRHLCPMSFRIQYSHRHESQTPSRRTWHHMNAATSWMAHSKLYRLASTNNLSSLMYNFITR